MKGESTASTALRTPAVLILLSCCGLILNLMILALPLFWARAEAAEPVPIVLFYLASAILFAADQTRALSGHGPEPPAKDGPYQLAALSGGILLLLLQWASLAEFLCSAQKTADSVSLSVAGFLLVCTGSLLRAASILALGDGFRSDRANQRLVTGSVFQYARHPSEAGLILACCGIPLILCSWQSGTVLLPLILRASVARIRHEETWLEADFGQRYLEYQRQVGPWMPLLLRKR